MRGEKAKNNKHGYDQIGSSPHARGKEADAFPGTVHLRIIPACAGKRSASLSSVLGS